MGARCGNWPGCSGEGAARCGPARPPACAVCAPSPLPLRAGPPPGRTPTRAPAAGLPARPRRGVTGGSGAGLQGAGRGWRRPNGAPGGGGREAAAARGAPAAGWESCRALAARGAAGGGCRALGGSGGARARPPRGSRRRAARPGGGRALTLPGLPPPRQRAAQLAQERLVFLHPAGPRAGRAQRRGGHGPSAGRRAAAARPGSGQEGAAPAPAPAPRRPLALRPPPPARGLPRCASRPLSEKQGWFSAEGAPGTDPQDSCRLLCAGPEAASGNRPGGPRGLCSHLRCPSNNCTDRSFHLLSYYPEADLGTGTPGTAPALKLPVP